MQIAETAPRWGGETGVITGMNLFSYGHVYEVEIDSDTLPRDQRFRSYQEDQYLEREARAPDDVERLQTALSEIEQFTNRHYHGGCEACEAIEAILGRVNEGSTP